MDALFESETWLERMTRALGALDRHRSAAGRYDEPAFLRDEETKSAMRYADIFVRTMAGSLPVNPAAHLAAIGLNAHFRADDPTDHYVGDYVFKDGFPHEAIFLVHEQLRRSVQAVRRKLATAPMA